MKSTYIFSTLLFCVLLYTSCEDPIDVDSGFETSQLVVDAWVNNNVDETQIISLSLSQDYFDNRLPDVITDANVSISTATESYAFLHTEGGKYSWTPDLGSRIGEINETFTLTVNYEGETYTSTTRIDSVPEIDSIRFELEENMFGTREGLFAQVYARDLPGIGNTYWIKSYRNDTLLNKPQELNIAFDSTFDPGTNNDGNTFIRPIRFAVNALDDDSRPRNLRPGNKVGCEIHSISNEAFNFLKIVQEQTTNGDNAIFSLPIANSRGNIFDSSGKRVLGVFNVAAISRLERTVE